MGSLYELCYDFWRSFFGGVTIGDDLFQLVALISTFAIVTGIIRLLIGGIGRLLPWRKK